MRKQTVTERLTEGFDLMFVVHVQTYEDGRKLFTAEERGIPSLVTIDPDGHVMIKNNNSAWWDYLGRFLG